MNNIKIVYNNMQGSNKELMAGIGFSAYIQFQGHEIIFDTGGDSTILMSNLKKMNIKVNNLDAVFISHNHWDHVFGLPGVLRKTKFKTKVYVPDKSVESIANQIPRADIIVNPEPTEILKNVWSSGAMKTDYRQKELYEHSLLLMNKEKATVITGCSHPDIISISEKILSLPFVNYIDIIIGGFHWKDLSKKEVIKKSDKLKNMKINKIAPSHCTGDISNRILKNEWNENFVPLFLGDTYICR